MGISYKPLWKILLDRNMTKTQLRNISGVSTTSIAKMGRNENVTTGVLLKISDALHCNVNEIIESYPDEKNKEP